MVGAWSVHSTAHAGPCDARPSHASCRNAAYRPNSRRRKYQKPANCSRQATRSLLESGSFPIRPRPRFVQTDFRTMPTIWRVWLPRTIDSEIHLSSPKSRLAIKFPDIIRPSSNHGGCNHFAQRDNMFSHSHPTDIPTLLRLY
jgi:hypothetical protein